MKARVLILSDLLPPPDSQSPRGLMNDSHIRLNRLHSVATSVLPHATLLGPVLVGTILRGHGYDVDLLECAFHPLQRRNLEEALGGGVQCVLISTSLIQDVDFLRNQIAMIRAAAPQAKIVLGGQSLLANKAMRSLADACLLGDAEPSVAALVSALVAGRSLDGISGACWLDGGQERGGAPAFLENIDAVPLADWDLVRRAPGEYHSLATQRGCYYRCAFCTYPANEGYKNRYMSIARVIEELRRNYEKFGVWRYVFADSTFSFPRERCRALLEAIKSLPFAIEWIAYARADDIDSEIANLMARSGCRGLHLGCDSGDDYVLKRMNKRLTAKAIRGGVSCLAREGIATTTSWVMGFPGETDASAQRSLDLMLDLDCTTYSVNTFFLYEMAPAGMRRAPFKLEGAGLDWRHDTMDGRSAQYWTEKVLGSLRSNGKLICSIFDIAWFASVGMSDVEVFQFYRKAQAQELSEDGRMELERQYDEIYSRAVACPVFQASMRF